MAVIDPAKATVLRTVKLDAQPSAVAVDAKTGRVYVAEQKTGNVVIYNGKTYSVLGRVKAGSTPYAMAADSTAGKVYVANMFSNDVTVITGALAHGKKP